jgi:Family of unknown function (DUF6411)
MLVIVSMVTFAIFFLLPKLDGQNNYGLAIVLGIVGVCIVLLILGFLLPRLSIWPQRSVDRTLGSGQRAGEKAPGRLGKWLQKPFSFSRRAADRSAGTGRRARGKSPV